MPSSSHDSQSWTEELNRRQAIRTSLTDWATLALSSAGQAPAAHHRLLIQKLEAVSRSEIDRLLVLMPPGSAKSTYASILFPAWWFTQHAASSVIATSHTTSLAVNFGRQVKELVQEHGLQLGLELLAGNQAAGHWRTSGRGDYFATGTRGPLIGRRADLVIIDDPVKSQAEADSLTMRDRLWTWYRSDLITRLKPGGRVVLIMTRWHDDDLAGRLLARQPAEWHIIRLPALAEAGDPLGRALDVPLWPEWEGAAALLRKRETIGERAWAALYQQSPRTIQGSLFKIASIDIVDTPPAQSTGLIVRAWDLAATAANGTNNPDWTVGLKLMRAGSGRLIVLDIMRLRGSPHDVENAIQETARIDGRSVDIGLPEDPGQAGKTQVSYLTSRLAGHRIVTSRETGAKTTRAGPVASQVEGRNVAIVRANWNHAFLEELGSFPFGRKDDQVDALARAFRMLTDNVPPARQLSVSYLAR